MKAKSRYVFMAGDPLPSPVTRKGQSMRHVRTTQDLSLRMLCGSTAARTATDNYEGHPAGEAADDPADATHRDDSQQ